MLVAVLCAASHNCGRSDGLHSVGQVTLYTTPHDSGGCILLPESVAWLACAPLILSKGVWGLYHRTSLTVYIPVASCALMIDTCAMYVIMCMKPLALKTACN